MVRAGIAMLAGLACAAAGWALVSGTGSASEQTQSGVLAFTSYRAGAAQIFTVGTGGSGPRRLTSTRGAAFEASPAFSPDGRRIAYVCGNFELCIMNADGSSQTRLTTNDWPQEFRYDRDPTWSPDGTKLAFTRSRKGRDAIWIVHSDGSGLRQLPVPKGLNGNPAFSPDGTTIAFDHIEGSGVFTSGSKNLWVIGIDGGGLRRLTDDDDDDADPAWSPDGARLVFSRTDLDSVARLFTMAADGSAERRLASGTASATDPAWSPDGATIAFVGRRAGRLQIYEVSSNGGASKLVTDGRRPDLDPAWQPSGPAVEAPAPTAAPSRPSGDARVVGSLVQAAVELLSELKTDPTKSNAREAATAATRVHSTARRTRSATVPLRVGTERGKQVRRLLLLSMREADGLADGLSGLSKSRRRHDRRAVLAHRNRVLRGGIATLFPLSEAAELADIPYAAISL